MLHCICDLVLRIALQEELRKGDLVVFKGDLGVFLGLKTYKSNINDNHYTCATVYWLKSNKVTPIQTDLLVKAEKK